MSSIAYPMGADPTAGVGTGLAAPTAATPAAPVQNPPAMPAIKKPALALNPQLPQVASSMPTDSDYEAAHAQLAAQISRQYNDVLKQLGYADPNTGQFVMGRVESEANRQRAELGRSMGLATEESTHARQLEGTLFSGRRATEQARAEHPFVQGLADLDINVPQQLTDLYEQAGNTVSDYTLQNNILLADLARRRAAAAIASGAPGAPPPGGPPPPTVPPPGGKKPPAPEDWTIPADYSTDAPAYQQPLIYYGRDTPGVM